MKKHTSLALAGLISLFSTASHADTSAYIGLSAGFSSYDYEDVDSGTVTKIYAGYKITDHIAIEATMYNSSDADITDPLFNGFSLNAEGLNISVLYRLKTSSDKITAMVGGGIYNFESTLKAPGGSISEDDSGLSLAGGLEYALTENLALRADIDMFFGVKDFADDSGMDSVNIGIVLNF